MQISFLNWHLVSELFQAKVLMVFVDYLLSSDNEWLDNLFDNPDIFKNVEKLFLLDIMTHNRHRRIQDFVIQILKTL